MQAELFSLKGIRDWQGMPHATLSSGGVNWSITCLMLMETVLLVQAWSVSQLTEKLNLKSYLKASVGKISTQWLRKIP